MMSFSHFPLSPNVELNLTSFKIIRCAYKSNRSAIFLNSSEFEELIEEELPDDTLLPIIQSIANALPLVIIIDNSSGAGYARPEVNKIDIKILIYVLFNRGFKSTLTRKQSIVSNAI